MKEFWNERYSAEEYIYGELPNEFFKEKLPIPGNQKKILLPAEGEGRNALWAAKNGWEVTAFDWSESAREKAMRLAEKNGVKYQYNTMKFEDFDSSEGEYDAVALIYIHLTNEQREEFFPKILRSLKPGGKLIFEAFEKDQMQYNSGGPKDEEMLYSLRDIAEEFIDLDFEVLVKSKIYLNEGEHHSGDAVVIRFCGVKN